MKKKIVSIVAAIALLLTFLGCGVRESKAHSVFVHGGEVYVAGWQSGRGAILWKNGVPKRLTDGKSYAEARLVYVSGNDVYVSGHVGFMNTLWKNGVPQHFKEESRINSVFVSGEDVYIAGNEYHDNEGNDAVLWKNDVKTVLGKGTVLSVYVSGKDVYAAGVSEREGKGFQTIPVVWKNGIFQSMPMIWGRADDNDLFVGEIECKEIKSVLVSGNDVYVAGYVKNPNTRAENSFLCKNGKFYCWLIGFDEFSIPFFLGVGDWTMANSICISGNDVYVAGTVRQPAGNRIATFWKNGKPQRLSDGKNNAGAESIFVSGGDVYVAGYEGNLAKIWKNGVSLSLK